MFKNIKETKDGVENMRGTDIVNKGQRMQKRKI